MEVKDTTFLEKLGEFDNPVISTYMQFLQLKNLFRQGWLRRGISKEKCESVADHSFSVAILSLLINDVYGLDLDLKKILIMALIHETGEIYAGDIIPSDGYSENEKYKLERKSIQKIISNSTKLNFILEIWEEFEKKETPEARFVAQIDKLDMFFQLYAYEKSENIELLSSFEKALKRINDNKLKEILRELFTNKDLEALW